MRRLKIRTPLVIHETVDGEVVMVNLETGNYYSLVGTGARIWRALERTPTAAEIVSELRAAFRKPEGGPAELEETVTSFLEELEREGLVVPLDDRGAVEARTREAAPESGARPVSNARPAPAEAGARSTPAEAGARSTPAEARANGAFEPPVLEKFTDMQELILLDPVHEVEEDRGWPHARPEK